MSTVNVDVQVENINDVMDTYNQLKLYRDTDPAGSFTTLIDTETLVADQVDYTLTDPAGGGGYVYRHLFYNSSTLVSSSLSDAYFPTGRTAESIIIEASRRTGGFRSTCSADGTTLTLVDDHLGENGLDEDYLDGSWIYRISPAAEGDWQRRTAHNPFDPSSNSLTIVRAWANLPAADAEYAIFNMLPPLPGAGGYSWLDALSDGLAETLVPDILDIGTGNASGNKDRFSLDAFAGYLQVKTVRKVWLRTYNEDDSTIYVEEDASKMQRYWKFNQNGLDDVHVWLSPPPLLSEHVIIDCTRKFARLYRPDDITLCPFDLAVAICVKKVYEHMNVVTGGKYQAQLALATATANRERGFTAPLMAVRQ